MNLYEWNFEKSEKGRYLLSDWTRIQDFRFKIIDMEFY